MRYSQAVSQPELSGYMMARRNTKISPEQRAKEVAQRLRLAKQGECLPPSQSDATHEAAVRIAKAMSSGLTPERIERINAFAVNMMRTPTNG